jgi:GT2 family glycosyltransferase
MISVVTVNYKTIDYTLKMLESLFANHTDGIEVFVVENGSGDDMSEIKKRFPQVKLIESEENLGFAGGCNLAIKESVGDYVTLINPDIIFEDDALYQMRDKMNQQTDVGIGGVSLKNIDGSQQACVWSFPTPVDQLLLLFKINHVLPNLKPFKQWLMKGFDYTKSTDVDQVMGAFFCIRREMIEQVGMLDDGFFIWYEEVDYCRRVKNTGWRVRYFADISARHKKGSSFDRVPTIKKQNILRKSIRRYMFKHYGSLVGTIFLIGEPVFWCLSVAASIIKPQ